MAALAAVAGAAISAVGTIAAGQAQQQAADYEAVQLEQRGAEERAASQREALERRKETDFLQSRNQAVAAASGLGATDDTVLDIAGDLEQAGEYRVGMTRYGGESRQYGHQAQARGRRMSGEAALQGSYFDAAGTILGGFSSLFSRYGGGGPRRTTSRPAGNYWQYT